MSVAEVDPEGNYVVLKNDSQEVLERFPSVTHLVVVFHDGMCSTAERRKGL